MSIGKGGLTGMSKGAWRDMRPAHVRQEAGTENMEVVFLESARFYKLRRENPKFEAILRELREAVAKKRRVRVLLDAPNGDVIEDVEVVG
jgi:predicted TIM-barrel fold metal-dependent hydrolase